MQVKPETFKMMKIGEAAKMLGVSPDALRVWEKSGILKPAYKSRAGTRYYSEAQIEQMKGQS